MSTEHSFEQVARAIWDDAVSRGFRGYDPYDGLRSRILWPLVRNSRPMRLAVQQFVRRLPVNLRPLLAVPRGANPKGLALFLSGITYAPFIEDATSACRKLQLMLLASASTAQGAPFFGGKEKRSETIEPTSDELRSLETGRIGWGYDFPWQSRAFFVPAYFPTSVCTAFVVQAFRKSRHSLYDSIARAAARFVSFDLTCSRKSEGICFSYSPNDTTCVYNASLFAAKLLALGWKVGGPKIWKEEALEAVRFVLEAQRKDGSWLYGEGEDWGWVDGLHTGFVLQTLEDLARILGTDDFDPAITRGLSYYSENLFEPDGTALPRPGQRYPMDPHTYAQGAITFLRLDRHCPDSRPFAAAILDRAIENLWDPDSSLFSTGSSEKARNRTRFMRWSQAWMFRALCYSISKGTKAK